VDAASEVVETEFFRFLGSRNYLQALAASYPSPRRKEEVPTWFFLASNLSLRLHGVHSFHAYPYVVRCGGLLNAFGPEIARKTAHPDTGDVTLTCPGFNRKNDYDRQTPCDQDFLRKFARDTSPDLLERWFNGEVPRLLKLHKVFDPEGIFLGDASYVFVPDNPLYEKSSLLLFDPDDHPLEATALAELSPQRAARCQWRRCYKLVSLLHTDRKCRFFLRIAARLLPGAASECPVLYDLVDRFVEDVGKGVMRRLILDRGFLDGAKIAHVKGDLGIDVLLPVRRNMDVYEDALGLLRLPEVTFQPYDPPRREPLDPPRLPQAPQRIRRREERRQKTLRDRAPALPPPPPDKTVVRRDVAGISGFRSWSSCTVPLEVIANRDTYADGHEEIWMLLDTKPLLHPQDPAERRAEYALRTEIEEGHRQFKCFWDLGSFTSRAFALILNQILFVLLAYNLLQIYLRSLPRPDLSRRTRPRLRGQLLPSASVILLYCQNRFATLSPLEYTELLLTLAPQARDKILEKTRRLRRELLEELRRPRAP